MDYLKSYEAFIPPEKHLHTKAEIFTLKTTTVELGILARFRRKGNCYSKTDTGIGKSLKLLCLKLNNELLILI
jgi:insertion element IS1 protein InsB